MVSIGSPTVLLHEPQFLVSEAVLTQVAAQQVGADAGHYTEKQ